MVYFIQSENFIKIGYAFNPKMRIITLQTSNPNKLIPLLVITGGYDKEKELHYKFNKFRVNGEWFKLSDEIFEFINENLEIDRRYECGLIDDDSNPNEQIKYWRKIRGLTVAEVAEKMGIKGPSYHSCEICEPTSNIGIRTMKKIAIALDCKFEYRFKPNK